MRDNNCMNTPTSKRPPSTLTRYFQVLIFSLTIFGLAYGYTARMGIPNLLNKGAADTAIILIGLSMILSGVCYFWNFFDPMIRYRKYLGLVGWAYGLAHLVLSFSTLQSLFNFENWQRGAIWPALTGVLATIIFTIMAAISNSKMAQLLGGKVWRATLRSGYIATFLILIHVILLKSARWITWYEGGMKTLPSMSLVVTLFIVFVLLMRVALWVSLKRKGKQL